MFKRSAVCQAVALALALPSVAVAEVSVTGYVKNETSVFTSGGQVTGQAKTTLDDTDYDGGELLKFENSARMFVTGDIADNTTWTADINIIYDAEGVNHDYKGYRLYTQHDWLRELYVDSKLAGWDFRLGKQQVVWGTADGIKLLDIINPTDYREFNQNTFEDSRIPIWMLKAERNLTDRSNIQFIVSQHEESKIPGLPGRDKDGDSGHPFIMKGVDTITGQVNGFLNVAPALGGVASAFDQLGRAFQQQGGQPIVGLLPFVGATVNGFATNTGSATLFAPACGMFGAGDGSATSAPCLKAIAEAPTAVAGPFGGNNQFVTNLIDADTQAQWNLANANSAFEYFPDATFATFNTFVNMKSKYQRDYPDTEEPNLGFRWKNTTGGGFSYSLNYFYAYDPNPSVSVHWENDEGEKLSVKKVKASEYVATGIPAFPVFPGEENATTVLLKDKVGRTYGAVDTDPTSPGFFGPGAGPATLVFEETVHRIHNIGFAFDTAIDQFTLPTVVRGEFLYQKDVRVPVIDRGEMAIGNVTQGLVTEKADLFKYVVGLDVTVMTNLLVSGQFIQFINLDHVDEDSGVAGYQRYTGDQAVLHLDNGLQEAEEYKEFYSLFFSKPFGPSQEHRWNNITIYEENDGWWDRFDVEYSFTDQLIGTAEVNFYWGNENTLFGQFENSSNFQIGMKYIFE
jgi:hypothetical protein